MQYPNEHREILAGKATDPVIEEAFDIFPEIEHQNHVHYLRYRPVLLEASAFNSQAVVLRNVLFSEPADSGGNLVLATVVIHETLLRFFERCVVLLFLLRRLVVGKNRRVKPSRLGGEYKMRLLEWCGHWNGASDTDGAILLIIEDDDELIRCSFIHVRQWECEAGFYIIKVKVHFWSITFW